MAKAKKSKMKGADVRENSVNATSSGLPAIFEIAANSKELDPSLAALFASSSGPIVAPPKPRYQISPRIPPKGVSAFEPRHANDVVGVRVDEEDEAEELQEALQADAYPRKRKRKQIEEADQLETDYLRKIRRDEKKTQSHNANDELEHARPLSEAKQGSAADGAEDRMSDEDESPDDPPQHESLQNSVKLDEHERSERTVFLANVSTRAITSKSAKKALMNHLVSFRSSAESSGSSSSRSTSIESLRFRSTAFSSTAIPKRASFARKELMDATTKSTNAYAVYATAELAKEAIEKLNGSVILDRHLRVDSVAKPAPMDHRRCVFVGNLGFVDDDSSIKAANEVEGEEKKKKRKAKSKPGDVEEGLWRQFSTAGTVENVRVIRDAKTRVGKGFAYVQFKDANAVESALLFDDKKYPPMLPRKLRVTRAKAMRKETRSSGPLGAQSMAKFLRKREGSNTTTSQLNSMAAKKPRTTLPTRLSSNGIHRSPESIVFEGHRASSRSARNFGGLRSQKTHSGGTGAGSKGKRGKPQTRSSRRGTAWKVSGGKKGEK